MKKILICGDSFSTDYQSKDSTLVGWVNLLSNDFLVSNYSTAGASEYRILKQIENNDISNYDGVIVCHTSPYRVYIKQHPVYKNDTFHKNTDLIYKDVEYHLSKINDPVLKTAKDYYELIFDEEYYEEIYFLMQDKIVDKTKSRPCLHLTPLFDNGSNRFKHHLNLSKKFKIFPNSANHYLNKDNVEIYKMIKSWIEKNV
jgi:hypothetical protein